MTQISPYLTYGEAINVFMEKKEALDQLIDRGENLARINGGIFILQQTANAHFIQVQENCEEGFSTCFSISRDNRIVSTDQMGLTREAVKKFAQRVLNGELDSFERTTCRDPGPSVGKASYWITREEM